MITDNNECTVNSTSEVKRTENKVHITISLLHTSDIKDQGFLFLVCLSRTLTLILRNSDSILDELLGRVKVICFIKVFVKFATNGDGHACMQCFTNTFCFINCLHVMHK